MDASESARTKFDDDVQKAAAVRGFLRPSNIEGTGLAALQAARPMDTTGDKLKAMASKSVSRPAEAGPDRPGAAVDALHIQGGANVSRDAPLESEGTEDEPDLVLPTAAAEDAKWRRDERQQEELDEAKSASLGKSDTDSIPKQPKPRNRYESETAVPGIVP